MSLQLRRGKASSYLKRQESNSSGLPSFRSAAGRTQKGFPAQPACGALRRKAWALVLPGRPFRCTWVCCGKTTGAHNCALGLHHGEQGEEGRPGGSPSTGRHLGAFPAGYFSTECLLALLCITASLLILPLVLPPLPPPPFLLLLVPVGIMAVLVVLAFVASDVRDVASCS